MASINNTKNLSGIFLIALMALLSVVGMLMWGSIEQDNAYHHFADMASFLGIQNFWNVVSNFPMLIVGLLGWYKLKQNRLTLDASITTSYKIFFTSIVFVSLGSVYYHLGPDNTSLIWDRLAMTFLFMSLISIIISEFISMKLGKTLLFPLLATGIFSILYWYLGEQNGRGDLRLYGLVQFFPVMIMPVIFIFFKSVYDRIKGYWLLLFFYWLSKIFEHFDIEIYQLLDFISGHTLKHVASALALYSLIHTCQKRALKTNMLQ